MVASSNRKNPGHHDTTVTEPDDVPVTPDLPRASVASGIPPKAMRDWIHIPWQPSSIPDAQSSITARFVYRHKMFKTSNSGRDQPNFPVRSESFPVKRLTGIWSPTELRGGGGTPDRTGLCARFPFKREKTRIRPENFPGPLARETWERSVSIARNKRSSPKMPGRSLASPNLFPAGIRNAYRDRFDCRQRRVRVWRRRGDGIEGAVRSNSPSSIIAAAAVVAADLGAGNGQSIGRPTAQG